MNYRDLVGAAAAALQRGEDANWELARLTFEACGPSGQKGPARTGYVSLERWSEDIRLEARLAFGATTARYYRQIWERFGVPRSGAVLPSWTDAYNEIRGVTNMDANMVTTNFNRALEYATPEQKQEIFQRIVRDEPAIVQEAWKDTETNVALSTARWEARDELHEPMREAVRETRDVFEPKDSTLDRRIFLADIATKVEQWTRELNGIRDFLEFSDDVDRVRRWATRQALDRLVEAAAACRDALPSSSEDAAPAAKSVSKRERRKLA